MKSPIKRGNFTKSFSGEVRKELTERRRLIKSSYVVGQPLEVVQLDHTLADILLVDPRNHDVIGRPTLTVAVDVATRCVMGFCVSLEAPSCLLAALCLEAAVFPKEPWLEAAGSTVQWPMHGLMKSVHTDNGREFHSRSFRRGCDLNGIDLIYRPPATPRFGGHIERLMGTFMRRTRLLPGNTYSDMLSRRPREAESKASLTLNDYRWFLTEEIERYHTAVHRTLGISPMSAWERAWTRRRGAETPELPIQRDRLLFDILPMKTRVITREGIEIEGLRFSHPDLQSEINPSKKRIVRIDPRDASRVYLEMTTGPYLAVPLQTDTRIAGMSWWEWRAIRRQGRAMAQPKPIASHAASAITPDGHAQTVRTPMRISRAGARRAEWLAVQAIQAMPVPDTSLQPVIRSRECSNLPWEILE
jgi:putative transposase